MIRSTVIPALENIALWHERDISHSSVERNIGPNANITLDFALVRLTNILLSLFKGILLVIFLSFFTTSNRFKF